MKKANKSMHGVWSTVPGKKNILEEFKNGKKTGRVAELVDLKTSKENKMDAMNEYMKKHKNVIVIYNSYSFEPELYKVTNK